MSEDRVVCAGFTEPFWHKWGKSWLISLRKKAKYDGKVLVVGLNWWPQIDSVETVSGDGETRQAVHEAVALTAKNNPGNYACWDGDVYFQTSLDPVFNAIDGQMLVTVNDGFMAGNSTSWENYLRLLTVAKRFKMPVTAKQFVSYFPGFVKTAPDLFNFVNMSLLHDTNGDLCFKNQPVLAVHPSGKIKEKLVGRKILFHERHPDLVNETKIKRRLL